MAVYEFTIKAQDQISSPVTKAKKSISDLGEKMSLLKDKMKGLEEEAFMAKVLGEGDKLKSVTAQWHLMNSAMEGLKAQRNALPDMEEKTSKWSVAAGLLTKSLELLAAGLLAAGAAFATVTLKGAMFAIEASEAKQQAISLWTALGEGKIAGDEVDEMLDGLRAKLGITKDAMSPFADALLQMGRDDLPSLSRGVEAATSAMALVKGGGDAFIKLAQKVQFAEESGQGLKIKFRDLAKTGLSVTDVANEMGISAKTLGSQLQSGSVNAKKFGDAMESALLKKGAGPLAMLSLKLENLNAMFHEYIGDLFEDLGKDIEPFMVEVRSLFAVFSTAKPSGQAMKAGIGGFFKETFALAAKLVPMLKHFFLDLIILSLKAYIALKPTVKTLKDMWEKHDGVDKLGTAMKALLPAVLGIAAVIGAVVSGFVLLGSVAVGVQVALMQIGTTIGYVGALIFTTLKGWASSAWTFAADFIAGLVGGIQAGVGSVIDAVKGLAGAAKDAFKGALGIASPSKVMMQLGAYAGQGVAEGMTATMPEVHAASSGLAGATAGGFAQQAAATPTSTSTGGVTVTVEAGAIVISGGQGQSMMEMTEDALTLLLERVALAQGL